MEGILLTVGRVAGAIGVLMVAVAAGTRLAGSFWFGSYEASTVMLAGMALMLAGCLSLLIALTWRQAPGSR